MTLTSSSVAENVSGWVDKVTSCHFIGPPFAIEINRTTEFIPFQLRKTESIPFYTIDLPESCVPRFVLPSSLHRVNEQRVKLMKKDSKIASTVVKRATQKRGQLFRKNFFVADCRQKN